MLKIKFLLCCLLPLFAISQSSRLGIAIHREKKANPLETKKSALTYLANDSIKFKGIPPYVRSFRVKVLKWAEHAPLYILYGVDMLNNYVVIFDGNFDKSFDGELVYRLDKSFRTDKAIHDKIFDTLTPTLIRQPHGTFVSVKPILYTNVKISVPEENEWMLLVSSREYKVGNFQIDGRQYSVIAYGSPNSDYQHRTLSFLIKPLDESYKASDLEMPYRLKEPFYFGNSEIVLDSLSQFADTLWVTTTANPQEIKGRRVGENAADFNALALDDNKFTLKQQRGKYVLLDFWGSWCSPCIELIPSLRELYNQFGSRPDFLMVSIAYDKREDASKVDSIVRKMKMDWVQIADWIEQENKIVDLYSVNTFPTTILINPQGEIVHRSSGDEGINEIKRILVKAAGRINKKPVRIATK